MATACPLNFQRVDENLSRLNTLLVVLLVFSYLYTLQIGILFFLIIDFSIKLFISKTNSPIGYLGKKIKKWFSLREKFIDGGAKRLAAYFGLSFMVLLLVSHFFENWNITLLIALLYLSCALLDVFFRFCIGCKIYFVIKKIYPNFMEGL